MSLRQRMTVRTKRAIRHMTPAHVVKTHMTRRTMRDFAEKVGMVYFGTVDARDDDYRLVRGHTVSATHMDDNYSVGTLRGYDAMVVLRNDVIKTRSKREQRCHWLICTIDLHTKADLPHVYIGHITREEAFLAAYERLHPIDIGQYAPYPAQFMSEYRVYGVPSAGMAIEQMITPESAMVIATHFQNASIEIKQGVLYLYIESKYPTEVLLEKMLSNALWLAESIDAAYAPPSDD